MGVTVKLRVEVRNKCNITHKIDLFFVKVGFPYLSTPQFGAILGF